MEVSKNLYRRELVMKKFDDAKILLFLAFALVLVVALKILPPNSMTWEKLISYLVLFSSLLKEFH